MGTLFYGAARFRVDFEDRALAHLQIVMTAKHRRGEGFLLSWTVPTAGGGSRSAVWVHPATDLEFSFSGGRAPEINREWIDTLVRLANTADGLHLTGEGDLRPAPRGG
ncbi:hypothetical protein ACFDTO_14660 [Microbacteriaceae bacterium 4G12]